MEQQEELTEEVLRDQLAVLQDLLKHQGWALLAKYANLQIKTRSEGIIFTPVSEQKGSYEQEFQKGECSGIYTTINLPEVIIDETKVQLKEMARQEPFKTEEDE